MVIKRIDITGIPGSIGSLAWGKGIPKYRAFLQTIRELLHVKASPDKLYKVALTWCLKEKGKGNRFLKGDLDNAAKPILDAIFNTGKGGKRGSKNRDNRVTELTLKKKPSSDKEYLWVSIQTISRK